MTMDNAAQPILTLSHIVKRFGGNVAVNDVSLQVMPGEVLALLGENGAGKSTLIKVLADSSEAFVQLARQGTTCCMIPHLQIEKELASGELIDLTPGLYQRRMLYWHRFAPESRMMRKVTDALLEHGHLVLRQD